MIVLLILELLAKFAEALWGPAPGEKATDQSEILDSGSHDTHDSLLQHDMSPNFFLQKSLRPYIYYCMCGKLFKKNSRMRIWTSCNQTKIKNIANHECCNL